MGQAVGLIALAARRRRSRGPAADSTRQRVRFFPPPSPSWRAASSQAPSSPSWPAPSSRSAFFVGRLLPCRRGLLRRPSSSPAPSSSPVPSSLPAQPSSLPPVLHRSCLLRRCGLLRRLLRPGRLLLCRSLLRSRPSPPPVPPLSPVPPPIPSVDPASPASSSAPPGSSLSCGNGEAGQLRRRAGSGCGRALQAEQRRHLPEEVA